MIPLVIEVPERDEELEGAVDEALALCGGDSRTALRALIVGSSMLESRLAEATASISRGYSRGRFERAD
ncbi:hypothetical protein [Methylobrevis pamukkalensis]|uniref:Uncharacterized protein n=1 Tax=Methylobrevis pamukkalensis TaxID=1439726 RepID=A0A1E3H3L6_9HYPH|nr:hypothetical protein [Methylobrevis pamukkalensis]ODN70131.1 hypothetical protein A6302_02553 [Methylobrevis pamukkalensis]